MTADDPLEWQETTGGELYKQEVLRPARAVVMRATYIGTEGAERITLLELSGTIDGQPYQLGIEFSIEDGARIGKALTEIVTQ